ncbi:MAG: hypothetical protein M1832_005046 [Thelocarpon impressellum]|nr:MAG: hypothetical protein M1832_005046 [Thelocarpon impressellum]
MTTSSTPLGALNAARRPGPQPALSSARAGGLPQDMQAKMKAFHLSRQGTPPGQGLRLPGHGAATGSASSGPGNIHVSAATPPGPTSPTGGPPLGALAAGMGGLHLPPNGRPQAQNWTSAPVVPLTKGAAKPGLGARRGMKLPGGLPGGSPAGLPGSPAGAMPKVDEAGVGGTEGGPGAGGKGEGGAGPHSGSMFSRFSDFVDTKTGTLRFAGKAVIHGKGVDFSSGSSFSISLDEVDNLEELGKGNYGTVYKVRHSRPQLRRPGLGLKGNRPAAGLAASSSASSSPKSSSPLAAADGELQDKASSGQGGTTGIIMAMKEIRLELDEAKFAAIIMELDILHRCISPFIVDFYGAFFQEGAVYICMEYMDGGSIDKLYSGGTPEKVLRKIALSTVMGLKALKEDHNIIHRDVKPTNILVNTRGQVKICDFGVSGNLVASIAKTNIGCQSYMAPERIASGGVAQAGANPGGGTYSVQSDIWSLGLTVIECALGQYPYPPETYNNIFSQLSAIVDGDPPDLPEEGFSASARDFVRGCLNKIPKLRPTYAMLLRHGWLAPLLTPPASAPARGVGQDGSSGLEQAKAGFPDTSDEEVAEWVRRAIDKRRDGGPGKTEKPALHAAPLDAVPSPSTEDDDVAA